MECRACGTASLPGAACCVRCGSPATARTKPASGETLPAPPRLPCGGCGALNPLDARFCLACGAAVRAVPEAQVGASPTAPMACPRCAALTPVTFAFCQQCGFKVTPRTASVPSVLPVLTKPWGVAIVVHRNGTDGERFALQGDAVTMGRARADVVFADDRFLAPQHARLERRANGYVLVALDQVNGVYRRVTAPTRLAPGDACLLGREVLRFEAVDAAAWQAPKSWHNVVVFGSPPRQAWGRLQQVTMAGPVGDVRHLTEPEVVIGREEGSLVFPDDPFLSRRHAVLRPVDGGCELTDLGSSNGSFVRLAAPWPLAPMTHIRLGDQLLRLELTP